MTAVPTLIRVLAVLLAATAPVAVASPTAQSTVPPVAPPTVAPDGEEAEEEDYGPQLSDAAMSELKLIMTRDVLPIMTQYAMAEFIWQADPAAACEAGKAVAAGGVRLQASAVRLRQTLIDNGDDVEAVDGRMRGLLRERGDGSKVQARFCDRMVAQNLNAQDKAAFKKGAAMLNTVMTELSEAVSAKVAEDDDKACVSMHVVAATASDFEDFIASEAKTSEVMTVMKRARVMRMVADIKETAENAIDECEAG